MHSLTRSDGCTEDGTGRGTPIVAVETVTGGGLVHSLTCEGHDASEDGTGRGTPIVVTPLAIRGREGGAELEIGEEGVANALRSSGGGGGGSLHQHVAIGFHATQDPITSDEQVLCIGSKSMGNGVADGTVVRRLTPTECERLQGFTDGWTDGQADSSRYKQLGNSVAVPVVEWIARRIVDTDS